MEFEDFFKRQVDELGKVLAMLLTGLAGLKIEDRFGEGLEQVKNTLDEDSALPYKELEDITPDDLLGFLENKKVNTENYENLAELFFELADGLEITDHARSMDFYEKSLKLHEYLNKTGSVYSFERHYKIDELRGILGRNEN